MIIEEEDFRLTPIDDHTPRFDLELLYEVRPRNGESRKEFKNVAYGISLDYAIRSVVQYRLSNNHKNEAISLLNYFEEFNNELNNFKDILQ